MTIGSTFMVLVIALGIEAVFGYPQVVYRRIGHPVTWIGALINVADARLNRNAVGVDTRRLLGIIALVIFVGAPVVVSYFIQNALAQTWTGFVILAVLASTLIASRSLYDHVRDVETALETGGLDAGRTAVSRIVGRDTKALDEHGVARAAIESLSENASDGVVAPVFWFAVLGLPGLVAYKAINTADSMIGHRTARHEAFGWAAARLDDLVNLPASRLTGALFAASANFVPGASARGAFVAMMRDARQHRSPNAGWPEAAMAGALDLKLAGPRTYNGTLVDDAYMGDARRDATADDIRRSLRLAAIAWSIMMLDLIAAAAIARA